MFANSLLCLPRVLRFKSPKPEQQATFPDSPADVAHPDSVGPCVGGHASGKHVSQDLAVK